ncbi:MAG: hypothetical protein ABL927_10995 [Bdellovibrionales bacterium]
MIFTNKHNLPDGIVNAVKNDSYTKGESDYSATGLLKPARQSALQSQHHDEIEEDVSDRIWSLLGQSIHTICERGNVSDLVEKRFFAKFGNKTVSAQIDSLGMKSGILTDYKTTTVYKAKPNQAADPDWTAQLNIQLELMRRNGLDASQLQIIAILRDWSKNKARQEENYAPLNVAVIPIEMWPREKTVAFIEMRIALHEAAKSNLPECSDDERWAKPSVFAVVKGKRAINGGVQFSEDAAQSLCAKNPGTRVEFRQGESMRCELYCSVNKFCSQYQKTIKKQEVTNEIQE